MCTVLPGMEATYRDLSSGETCLTCKKTTQTRDTDQDQRVKWTSLNECTHLPGQGHHLDCGRKTNQKEADDLDTPTTPSPETSQKRHVKWERIQQTENGDLRLVQDSSHRFFIAGTTGHPRRGSFDSDIVTLQVDSCASRCTTNLLQDFVRPPQKVIGRVKGMGGDKMAVTAVGTVKWRVDDEDGVSHSFLIPGSLYIPDSPARLFSPQHWAQESKDDVPMKMGHGRQRSQIML